MSELTPEEKIKIYLEEKARREAQGFSSEVLWHFTGFKKSPIEAFDIIKKIIRSKILKQGAPKITIRSNNSSVLINIGYVSLCDIPFKDLRIHKRKYGNIGLGFNKIAAINCGHFNPVWYVQHDHYIAQYIESVLPKIADMIRENKYGVVLDDFIKLIFINLKPTELTRPPSIDNDPDDRWDTCLNFYYEREWRSIHDWNFEVQHIEAIIVPKSYIDIMIRFLSSLSIKDIPIISAELIELL